MKIRMQHETIILLVVTMLLGACAPAMQTFTPPPADGAVHAVQMGNVMWGIRSAVLGKAGTQVLMQDSKIVFLWALRDRGWAFVCFDTAGKQAISDLSKIIGGKGNLVNGKDAGSLVDVLKSQGWKVVTAAQIPEYIKSAVLSSSSWMVQLSQSMTTFFIIILPMSPEDWLDIEREYIKT